MDKVAQPVIRKRQWPYPLIWILPILVAIGAGLYLRDYLADKGPKLVIEFSEATGLREGETRILHRGAEIGRVTGITLTENHRHALVHVQLQKNEEIFATEGAAFWIVRPEVSEMGLSGLGTLFSGPYIEAVPGKDEEEITEIDGMMHPPRTTEEGEKFVLTTSRLGHIQDGAAVYYKGIPVGSVQDIELAREADHLDVHIVVWTRYAALVRENSKFWVTSGVDFQGGIFSGIHLKLDSLKTMVSGGVAFATPEKDLKAPAKPGSRFAIEDDPKRDWEQWSPKISVSPRLGDASPKVVELPVARQEKKKK